jgi:hypothetical protein
LKSERVLSREKISNQADLVDSLEKGEVFQKALLAELF